MPQKQFTPEQAFQKLKQFCAYQERSHAEVKDKLYKLGVWKNKHDEILAKLIEENYLNEERFAIAFAGGKFRIKQWGRIKITYELKQKKVSDYCIKKALKQIDESDYLKMIDKLISSKIKSTKNLPLIQQKKKLVDYLVGKGFEWELVSSKIEESLKG